VEGIRPGSEVRILGSRVGRVRSVELRRIGAEEKVDRIWEMDPDEIQLVAILEVRGPRSVFVGRESRAVVRKDLAGFGASFVEITRGSAALAKGDKQLPLSREADMGNEVTTVLRDLQESLLPAIEQVNQAYGEVERAASTLADPEGEFQKAVAGLNDAVTRMNRGEGALGVLLRDDESAEDLAETFAGLNEAVGLLQGMLRDFEQGEGAAGALFRDEEVRGQVVTTVDRAEEAMSELPPAVRSADATIAEINEATQILQEGLREYQTVAEAMQRHWLLRRFVEQDEDVEPEQSADSRKAERERRGLLGKFGPRKDRHDEKGASSVGSMRKPRGIGGAGRR